MTFEYQQTTATWYKRIISLVLIIGGILFGTYLLLEINEMESDSKLESCVLRKEIIRDTNKQITFYCIDGYKYLSKNREHHLIPVLQGNYFFTPSACNCYKIKQKDHHEL